MHSKSSFTLIELLVVIAIVGILAGIIIVSMTNATNQATLAKAKVFAVSMRDSMSQNTISEWNFNNITDFNSSTKVVGTASGNIADSWGINNGTASGGPILMDESDCIFGKCLQFDGVDSYISIPDDVSTQPASITISSWIKGNSGSGANIKILSKRNNLTFYFLGLSSKKPYLGIGNGTNNDGLIWANEIDNTSWHFLVASFDGTSKLTKLYVDSQSISKTILYNIGDLSSRPVVIGGENPAGTIYNNFYQGYIDDVRIYNSAISSAEIKQQYYAGLQELLTNKEITQDEYNQKITGLEFNTSQK
jgi:prepilin-type N-terminal cleavage/methylation domain-containing protein